MTRHIEDDQQIAVVNWFRCLQALKQIPERYLLVHSNNSTQNLDTFAKRRNWGKRGGLAGVPDLVLYVPHDGYYGLFIEMKAESYKPKKEVDYMWWVSIKPGANGTDTTSHGVTTTQASVMHKLVLMGYKCVVCFTSDEAIQAIQDYLGLEF